MIDMTDRDETVAAGAQTASPTAGPAMSGFASRPPVGTCSVLAPICQAIVQDKPVIIAQLTRCL